MCSSDLFPDRSASKESACNAGDPSSIPGREDPLEMDRILPTPVLLGFPCGSVGKESTCNVGGPGSIPGLGRSRGEGKGYPLQYSGLENSMGLQRVGQDGVTFTFTGGLVVKNPPANTGDAGLVPWLGGGQGNPLQYSCLENPHLQRSLAGCSPLGCKRVGHE